MYQLGNSAVKEKAIKQPEVGDLFKDTPTSVEDVKVEELKEPQPSATASTHKASIPEQALNLGGFGDFFAKAIDGVIKKKAEDLRPEVIDILKAEVQKLKPTMVSIKGRASTGEIKGRTHKKFKDAVFLCEQERQLMMVGPAGSGKTTLAKQISKAFEIPFSSISCSAGMSEAHLLGRMLFDGTYVPSDFITAYENGGVFLFDEIDAADSNTLLVINSALANGYISVPNRKDNPRAERHEDFICVVAGNSWGNGSSTYQGRGYLDAAFVDRFSVSKLNLEYDKDLEKEIAGEYTEVLDMMWKIRETVFKQRIKRIVSTRAIVSAVRQVAAGKSLKQVQEVFTTDWSDEERKKIGNII